MDLRKILLISLGHLSCDLNGGALPSLMPYLAAAHGFNYQAAGALMFAYSATSSLVQPVFGYLADKHARSWFVPLAVLLAGGSLGLVGFLDSYWAIFLTLMLCGVGGALFHPEGARYANLVSGNRKGAGMSIFSVGGNSGFVVGPLLVAGATFVAACTARPCSCCWPCARPRSSFSRCAAGSARSPRAMPPPDRPNRATTGMPSAC